MQKRRGTYALAAGVLAVLAVLLTGLVLAAQPKLDATPAAKRFEVYEQRDEAEQPAGTDDAPAMEETPADAAAAVPTPNAPVSTSDAPNTPQVPQESDGPQACWATQDELSYEPDVVLLNLAEGVSAEQACAALEQLESIDGQSVPEVLPEGGCVRLEVAEGSTVEDAVGALLDSGVAESAQPNFLYYAMGSDEADLRDLLQEGAEVEPPAVDLQPSSTDASAEKASSSEAQAKAQEDEGAQEGEASDDGGEAAPDTAETAVPDEGDGATQTLTQDERTDATRADEASTETAASPGAGADQDAATESGSAADQDAATESGSAADSDEASQTSDAVTDLDADPDAEAAAGPSDLLEALAASVSDPEAPNQWALSSVRAYEAWAEAVCDGAVSIAVLDQYPDASHADLAANVVGYYDAYASSATTSSFAKHGTHVAGIAAAVTDNDLGVASVSHNAGLIAVNVFDGTGSSNAASTTSIADAYRYLMDHATELKLRVINLSFGGKVASDAPFNDWQLATCINEAFEDYGIVTVAAAGNQSDGEPYYVYPGDVDKAVSVINLRQNGSDVVRASSSNYNVAGQTTKDISAPGTAIKSTTPSDDYGTLSGTSMATAQVSGVLALMFAANPELTAQEAVNILYATARDLGDEGWDEEYGYGEVDAYRAVVAARDGAVGELEEPMTPADSEDPDDEDPLDDEGDLDDGDDDDDLDEDDEGLEDEDEDLDEDDSEEYDEWSGSEEEAAHHESSDTQAKEYDAPSLYATDGVADARARESQSAPDDTRSTGLPETSDLATPRLAFALAGAGTLLMILAVLVRRGGRHGGDRHLR